MSQSFGCTRVLNMPLVLNMPGFWIYQSSEYAKVTKGLEFAWIIPEYAWICLIMFGYVLEICLNMSEYAWICLNMPEWPLVLHFSISLLVLQSLENVVTCLNVYRRLARLEVIVWKNKRLFSWRNKIWFFL